MEQHTASIWLKQYLQQHNLSTHEPYCDPETEGEQVSLLPLMTALREPAFPAEQAEIDRLVTAFFALFNNRDGRTVNLDHIHELCLSHCPIIKSTGPDPQIYTLQSFIEPRQAMLEDGTLTEFEEWERNATTTIHGHVATRVCTFEKRGFLAGKPFAGEGHKTFQLVNTHQGWRIAAVAWYENS